MPSGAAVMNLERYLDRQWILLGLAPADKGALLETLAIAAAERSTAVDRQALLDRLLARERQGSTGIGNGVAVPHAAVEGLDHMRCLLAQVPHGLDFGAVDGRPVRFVFLLLGPAAEVGLHLKLLARIARLVRDPAFVDELASAVSADELHRRVLREDERHRS